MRKDLRRNLLVAAHNRYLEQRNEISYDARRPDTPDEQERRFAKRNRTRYGGWNEPLMIGNSDRPWKPRPEPRATSLEDAGVQHGGFVSDEFSQRRRSAS